MRFRFACLAFVAFWIVGCGTMQKPFEHHMEQPTGRPQIGRWTLHYTGGCAGRESETIEVARVDDAELVFGDFHLQRKADGVFAGSADFIAPMPADGRDVIYTVTFALRLGDDGKFAGTEAITEDGGHSLDCPVELAFAGA